MYRFFTNFLLGMNGAQPGGMPLVNGSRQVNGTNANRLSPDSGRGSDKTAGSDTSNSYASEKETSTSGGVKTMNGLPSQPPNPAAMNGLPPFNTYGIMRSASASQMPYHQQQQSQSWRPGTFKDQIVFQMSYCIESRSIIIV